MLSTNLIVHTGSRPLSFLSVGIERPLAISMPATIPKEQEVVVLQKQGVHPSKKIQHSLDLWTRVWEYDERSATEDFTPVLTRKQKQKLKLQQVLAK